MIPYRIEEFMHEVVEATQEDVDNDRFDHRELYQRLAQLARRAIAAGMDAGRVDEIARIQKNTLDADYDVWSQDDEGELISLTDRYNMLS